MKSLDKAMSEHKEKGLKAFVIFLTEEGKAIEPKLTGLAEKAGAKDIMLTYLSPKDRAVNNYKVNTASDVKNTVIVYRNKRVTSKFVNLKADEKGLTTLKESLTQVIAN